MHLSTAIQKAKQNSLAVPLQVGVASFQCPLSVHVVAFAPRSSKPGSQLKLQLEFSPSPVNGSLHFVMTGASASGNLQVTADAGK